MLGRPEVDPHGDPIPGPEGSVPALEYDDLLTCPVGSRSRFPVSAIRTAASSSSPSSTISGPGQSSRSRSAIGLATACGCGQRRTGASRSARARRQRCSSAPPGRGAAPLPRRPCFRPGAVDRAPPNRRPFKIMDNSFLVEEAFNQEKGVVQNIFGAVRARRHMGEHVHAGVAGAVADAPALLHHRVLQWRQASGFGDTLINYRYQVAEEGPGRPAFSPRVSLVLPTGSRGKGLGDGTAGLQVNLPFSKQRATGTGTGTAGSRGCRGRRASPERHGETTRAVRPGLAVPRRQRDLPAAPDVPPDAGTVVSSTVADPGRNDEGTHYTLSPGSAAGGTRRRAARHRRRDADHVDRATRPTPACSSIFVRAAVQEVSARRAQGSP